MRRRGGQSHRSGPSYGVFLVDIFASSVGIFLLICVLHAVLTASKNTAEKLTERFRTLAATGGLPVGAYDIPDRSDPLHDWGVRARHAREAKKPLILTLSDGIQLYHTGEKIPSKQLEGDPRLKEYVERYLGTDGRIFLEVHSYASFHYLNDAVRQARPPSTELWVHWAIESVEGQEDQDGMPGADEGEPEGDTTDPVAERPADRQRRRDGDPSPPNTEQVAQALEERKPEQRKPEQPQPSSSDAPPDRETSSTDGRPSGGSVSRQTAQLAERLRDEAAWEDLLEASARAAGAANASEAGESEQEPESERESGSATQPHSGSSTDAHPEGRDDPSNDRADASEAATDSTDQERPRTSGGSGEPERSSGSRPGAAEESGAGGDHGQGGRPQSQAGRSSDGRTEPSNERTQSMEPSGPGAAAEIDNETSPTEDRGEPTPDRGDARARGDSPRREPGNPSDDHTEPVEADHESGEEANVRNDQTGRTSSGRTDEGEDEDALENGRGDGSPPVDLAADPAQMSREELFAEVFLATPLDRIVVFSPQDDGLSVTALGSLEFRLRDETVPLGGEAVTLEIGDMIEVLGGGFPYSNWHAGWLRIRVEKLDALAEPREGFVFALRHHDILVIPAQHNEMNYTPPAHEGRWFSGRTEQLTFTFASAVVLLLLAGAVARRARTSR